MTKTEHRRKARYNLEDSYIKRILRKKWGFMAKDCTPKIIKETRESIKNLRKKKKLSKKLLAEGKYKCSRCSLVKPLDMFYKDSSKKCGFNRACKKCVSVSKPYKKASKKYNKRIRENLEDIYIKRILCRRSFLKSKDIPKELIEAKREQLKLKRFLEKK
tara:strand:- start:235 stop:714 length:480 start_codon:yes stop_codon:yes gene_type:complete